MIDTYQTIQERFADSGRLSYADQAWLIAEVAKLRKRIGKLESSDIEDCGGADTSAPVIGGGISIECPWRWVQEGDYDHTASIDALLARHLP